MECKHKHTKSNTKDLGGICTMKLTNDLKKNVEIIDKKLNVGKTFDTLTRIIDVHNTKFYLYYLDGFVKDTNL